MALTGTSPGGEGPCADGGDARYRSLFEAMTEGVAICEMKNDADGNPCDFICLDVNPAFERESGLPRAAVCGKGVMKAIPGIEPSWIETCARVVAIGEPARIEGAVASLGRTFHVFAYRTGPQRFAAVFSNVTERHRMEETLRESEEWFRAMFEHAVDGIVVIGEDGTVSQMNPAARAFFRTSGYVAIGVQFPWALRGGDTRELRVTTEAGDERVLDVRVVAMEVLGRRCYRASLRDVTDLARAREDLRAAALIDDLTQVFNRRGLMTLGAKQIAHARRTKRPLWLLFADVDGMKTINDELGHANGDSALQDFADVLVSTLRQSDIVARIGGDEFAALALDTNDDGVKVMTERIRTAIEARNDRSGRPYRLAYSLGVACFDPENPCTIEALMGLADRRIYAQKRDRRISGVIKVVR
ncbi:MAG: GGDEF domain-containing protein [Deltaproteobacteria bacterium]|nr:GGDEF domain-containing protein [Deltaproteobacteria bacterium]